MSIKPAKPRSDRRARILVFKVKLNEWRETESQTILVGLRKFCSQDAVQQKAGFEIRSSGRIVDGANPVAQVQLLRSLSDGAEQAKQAPPEIRRLTDVRLGTVIVAAKKKDGRTRGSSREGFGVQLRREFDVLG
jgi:hypothetical protein